MLRQISALLPEALGKSLLVVLILLTPGSFLLLPVLALFRLCARHGCNGAIQLLHDYCRTWRHTIKSRLRVASWRSTF